MMKLQGKPRSTLLFVTFIEVTVFVVSAFFLYRLHGPGWWRMLAPSSPPWKLLCVSILLAAACQSLGLLLYSIAPAYRKTVQEIMSPLFEGFGIIEVSYLAFWAGLAEELLFRGLLQPVLGIPLSSVVFAFLHCGVNQALLTYGLFAFIVSLILGVEFAKTASLFAPMATHFFIDLFGGILLSRQVLK